MKIKWVKSIQGGQEVHRNSKTNREKNTNKIHPNLRISLQSLGEETTVSPSNELLITKKQPEQILPQSFNNLQFFPKKSSTSLKP